MKITGDDLIAWGYKPGPWFKEAIESANLAVSQAYSLERIKELVATYSPPVVETLPLRDIPRMWTIKARATNADEIDNINSVMITMNELMRTPVITDGAVLPDACPAGDVGTIPVGGVFASPHIHPGGHSADICCSMFATFFPNGVHPADVLDVGSAITHFGGGPRQPVMYFRPPADLLEKFEANPFLKGMTSESIEFYGTQGDGNHFLFVGMIRSSGGVAMVTHHGSRKPGAMLYKRGMQAAIRHTEPISPETLKVNSWIDGQSKEGEDYWQALQLMRQWTKGNHEVLHDTVCELLGVRPVYRFWNEHNFIFRRGDSYLHGKGATPAWRDYAWDASGMTLIPLNMASPILMVRGLDNPYALGFAPHGAGRNFSRKKHLSRQLEAGMSPELILTNETMGIDCRFHFGIPDLSELPSAYKSANTITAQIEDLGLAKIIDYIDPHGCVMAGDWTKPMIEKRRAQKASRT